MKMRRFVSAALAAAGILCSIQACKERNDSLVKVVITPSSVVISEEEEFCLSASVLPEGASHEIKWSSLDGNIASVDANGKVRGIYGGTTYINASAGGYKGGCLVKVLAHVRGVELDCHETEIDVDGVRLLTASVIPANALNDTVYWTSTAPDIASVGNGLVTGIRSGEADIIVTTAEGGFTDRCHVWVTTAVRGITLDRTSAKINVGESLTLVASVVPEDAAHKEVRWESSDPAVASVDASGKTVGKKKGHCTITAYSFADSFSASCEIEVYAAVTGVAVSPKTCRMYAGDRASLTARVLPQDADNQAVSWKSSAPDIVTVDALTGIVKAEKTGAATITVTTEENGFTDSCEITVVPGTESVTGITLDKEELRLRTGGKYELYATVLPTNAANKNIIWSSSDAGVASVAADGKVTAEDVGTALITAKTEDGGFTAVCKVTVVAFDSVIGGLDDYEYIWN